MFDAINVLHKYKNFFWWVIFTKSYNNNNISCCLSICAVPEGGDHAGLPSWECGGDVQQLPGGRWAVGGHGVPGGGSSDWHCDSHEVKEISYGLGITLHTYHV